MINSNQPLIFFPLWAGLGVTWCFLCGLWWNLDAEDVNKINLGAGLDERRAPSQTPPFCEAHLYIPNMFEKRELKLEKLYFANYSAS